ncbi:hypothetical protein BDV95DRAFT_357493 [Massariosphaeria phaeospora]|uniref:Uncharacterized protein n=1 Tax=Massariosphaeria phaeospora TaxID=100035 RepID=A0A7C8I7T0_9PLEO|nr:hypothetical protein BDV95DRAFT_357493 [Massariosphaeria phaeospora]
MVCTLRNCKVGTTNRTGNIQIRRLGRTAGAPPGAQVNVKTGRMKSRMIFLRTQQLFQIVIATPGAKCGVRFPLGGLQRIGLRNGWQRAWASSRPCVGMRGARPAERLRPGQRYDEPVDLVLLEGIASEVELLHFGDAMRADKGSSLTDRKRKMGRH